MDVLHEEGGLVGLVPAAEGWPSLGKQALVVLVGVTGVGKSSALAALPGLKVLPDRREITDAVMILPVLGRPVRDREERFALSADYRRTHPGGMAQALGSLHADPTRWSGPLVFDGLRGADEVRYAAEQFPAWRFVSLHAPDALRVRRLLGRADSFDQVAGRATTSDLRGALERLEGSGEVFGAHDLDELAALTGQGYSAADILTKARIVVSERRNYDPQAARSVLAPLPAWRHLELDTVQVSAQQVAERVAAWLPLEEGP
ncbi:ATPase [Deinococcus sp.]|uniref:ATPase n=1 Tax=Deinococcus sp. TaxID=47478 RepID=UPI003CC5D1A4